MSTGDTTTYAITTRDGRSGWIEVLDGRITGGWFMFPGCKPYTIEFLESHRPFNPTKENYNILAHHLVSPRIQP